MIYLDDVKINELSKYKIDNESDIGRFHEIGSKLPGNISRSGGGLVWGKDTNIQVSYGYYGGK